MITQAQLQALFDYDPATGNLIRKTRTANSVRIGDVAGSKNVDGYIQISIDSKPYMAHRLVWLWHGKELPQFIDHINRNKADNRIENLELWVEMQPSGQRVEDKVQHALEILRAYAPEYLKVGV
jgi:hypothetical protein